MPAALTAALPPPPPAAPKPKAKNENMKVESAKESEGKAVGVPEKREGTVESIVTCKLCTGMLKQPVTLNCLHSFCNQCFKDSQDSKSDTMLCPTCSAEVKGSPCPDLKLARMVKIYETKIPECQNCLTANSTSICTVCNVSVCAKCWDETHSARIFKNHTKQHILKGPEGFEKCKDHPSVNAEFVCMDCNVLVCHACILRGSHVNHKYHSVEVHRQNENNRLEDRIQWVKGTKHKLIAATEGVDQQMMKVDKSYKSVCGEIDSHFDQLSQAMQRRRESLLEVCKSIKDKKMGYLLEQKSEFQRSLESIDEAVSRSKEMVSHSFDDDLSKTVDFVCSRLSVVEKVPATNPHMCSKCDFKGVTCLCPRETGKIFGTFDENLVGLISKYGVVDTKKYPTAFARAINTEHAQNIATGIQTALGSSWASSCSVM